MISKKMRSYINNAFSYVLPFSYDTITSNGSQMVKVEPKLEPKIEEKVEEGFNSTGTRGNDMKILPKIEQAMA